jgi:hypothetical protein
MNQRVLNRSSTPTDWNSQERVEELLMNCEPFLSSTGKAYCYMINNQTDRRICHEIRSQDIRDIIIFRHHQQFGCIPSAKHIDQAIALVVGRLWDDSIAVQKPLHLVTRLLLQLTAEVESGVGSASELRDQLVIANGYLEDGLPPNPSALGRLLTVLVMEAREVGIELHRPKRFATKRLWVWRRHTFNDANDTTMTDNVAINQAELGQQPVAPSGDDSSDGLTVEQHLHSATTEQGPTE